MNSEWHKSVRVLSLSIFEGMVTWSIQGAKPEFDRWSTICQHRTSRESCASLIRKSNRLYCMTILSVIKYYPLHIAYEGKPPALKRSNRLYRARVDNYIHYSKGSQIL